jgi:hypothetical protein
MLLINLNPKQRYEVTAGLLDRYDQITYKSVTGFGHSHGRI